ncbi:transketolase family protein [Sphingosinicella soli]|uniref:Transketolase n=1 Tax=Sphingosinicella soli TaxID=333708 RepID=A0A7W7AZZ8_9SPHN|nr:transketolase C-terminal domain-containing protein [Sphingosinicella soli]MBB4631495.1 transketolase [Sphingosinicella soli]
MRAAFSDALVAAAEADKRVLLLTGDHGYALFDAFRRECPEQYINCGIAEQNMVGVAAGLAKAGFRPLVYGLAAFVPIRVLEQIKIDVCYEGLPVGFIGDGAGVVYSHLGASHQSTEDIAALRPLPGISIYSPADRHELTACMRHMLQGQAPAYLRMGKADMGDVHAAPLDGQNITAPLLLGEAGGPLLLVATGSGTRIAQHVVAMLGQGDILSVPCIKPFDPAPLKAAALGRQLVAVIEEHSVVGGLGSLVAETLVGTYTGDFLRIGMGERFSERCGSHAYLLSEHGLAADAVAARLRGLLAGAPA